MKKTLYFLVMAGALYGIPAASEPAQVVSLSDYAFDFPIYGYEITVTGETSNFTDKLTADDHITIEDEGYTLKTLVDRMNRKDRKQFISFFNSHCIVGFGTKGCTITAAGDIELNENMRMIFRMSTANISMGGNDWSNSEGN